MVRIAIVDDDLALRDALADALSAIPGFSVIARAASLEEARAQFAIPRDVFLIDIGLPDGSGLGLIDACSAAQPASKTIVLSVFGDAPRVLDAIERGANGYLLKGVDGPTAAEAIQIVLAGGAPLSPAVGAHILARLRKQPRAATKQPLTGKEMEVLTDLSKGLSYKEVAQARGLSPHTVGDHVKSIYRKLAVNSKSEAVFEAVQTGLIDLDR